MELQDRGYNTLTSLITTIIVAAGVLGQAFLYMILGINVSDVPVVVMIEIGESSVWNSPLFLFEIMK